MRTRFFRILWSSWLSILVLGSLFSLPAQSARNPQVQPSSANTPSSPTWTEIILERPILTPDYGNGPCDSGWYRYRNIRDRNAFLALNVAETSESRHSGIWRPDLPLPGTWEVSAFIPKHGPATWDCPDFKITVSKDTSHATYTIHHAQGRSTVTVDQYPLNDQWVSLGKYTFTSGTSGYVALTDVTGEIKDTTTVSFSALRFTFIPYSVHLPLMREIYPSVLLNEAWTSPPGGHRERSFYPGETILFSGSGVNTTSASAQADFTWMFSGSCPDTGPFTSIYTQTHTLAIGDWTRSYSAPAPSCTGYFTYTLQVDYNSRSFVREWPFVVNDPGAGSILSIDPAFDKCEIPTLTQAQTWWEKSPYRVVNLYIGGVHRACANTGLNASWLRSASQMGWEFIPTWVGPQPPCSNFRYKINPDPYQAYLDGRKEADDADKAASSIGLPRDSVIYYDLESYAGSNVTAACRNAVKSFMNGWVERLHELGREAGAYGSPRGSYMTDWLEVANPPEYVWIAVWNQPPYYYDPNATVWVPDHLSNSLWANHQRIRQYTNSHTETWGGVPLTIDSNISDGAVAALPRQLTAGDFSTAPSQPLSSSPLGLQDSQLIDSRVGWSLSGGRLYWTQSAGRGWSDITPGESANVLAAFFLDGQQGWVIGTAALSSELRLYTTDQAGENWQTRSLPELGETGAFRIASLQFVDALNGWIVVQHVSSSNFSPGSLWKTSDGGRTWEKLPLPLGEPARFIDARRGWIAGGAGGNELYTTKDSGYTWQAATLPRPALPGQTYIGLPAFVNGQLGMLAVMQTNSETPRLELYTTLDGGDSWNLAQEIPLLEQNIPGAPPLAVVTGAKNWIVAWPQAIQRFTLTSEQNLIPQAPMRLPEGTITLHMSDSSVGWARSLNGVCTGTKVDLDERISVANDPFYCELRHQLWLTIDGGTTWMEITP